jgi:hypothetical protein
MVKAKGHTRPLYEESPAPEENPSPLMAEIDAASGQEATAGPVPGEVGDDTPTAPEVAPVPPQAPTTERWGRVMSRMNYPVGIQHQGGAIRLSPRAIQRVDGNQLVGTLPKGVTFVPDRR